MRILFTALAAISCGATLYYRERPPVAFVAKAFASSSFVVVAYFGGAFTNGYGRMVVGGLVAGLIGDLALTRKTPSFFLFGLSAFFAGHLCYLVAFLLAGPDGRTALIALAVAIAVAIGLAIWLRPHLPEEMRKPVLWYLALIALMTAAGVSIFQLRPTAAIGAVASWRRTLP